MMAVTESDHRPVGFYAAGAPNAESGRWIFLPTAFLDARRSPSSVRSLHGARRSCARERARMTLHGCSAYRR
jgi:hypothetical protein